MVHMQMIELCIAKLVVPQITLPIQVLIDVFWYAKHKIYIQMFIREENVLPLAINQD
jgi:hypothetical protein